MKDDILKTLPVTDNNSSLWFWVAVVELIAIVSLLIYIKKRKPKIEQDGFVDIINESKSKNIDMSNLFNSINNAQSLYKTLSKVCHPDRFVNTEKIDIANDLFQEISKNKRNFQNLLLLKNRAEKELGITIY